ncbi:hypothetical protein ACJROX_27245 [Pseudalkalibacillus sp. A8]|uniref:hypothetical protein n=1 Tax=Pseudalkalibacillus sp. A8 TaxID=3382641 RepID=UPI0038B4846D
MKKYEVHQTIRENKIIAVIRGDSEEDAYLMAKLAIEGGIKIIEMDSYNSAIFTYH